MGEDVIGNVGALVAEVVYGAAEIEGLPSVSKVEFCRQADLARPTKGGFQAFRVCYRELHGEDEMFRSIIAWIALGVVCGLSTASIAEQRSPTTPPIVMLDSLSGHYQLAASQEGQERQWKHAQSYCAERHRHATIQMADEVNHVIGFHCYRRVTREQFSAGDTGY